MARCALYIYIVLTASCIKGSSIFIAVLTLLENCCSYVCPPVPLVLWVSKFVLLIDIIIDVLQLALDIVTAHPAHALVRCEQD